jgi:hypothetical protein
VNGGIFFAMKEFAGLFSMESGLKPDLTEKNHIAALIPAAEIAFPFINEPF